MTWAAGQKLMGRYCIDCHDADLAKGDLDLEKLTKATVLHDYKLWQNLPALQW
ncbi:MAG: c-type cytochrome domain-containing protein [Planctomycetota bacterium]|jgi:mono/diheme cytochrome c family protein|nr:c-type cytochrome domain-containing protein [Planctomycetota bacterium]